MAFMQVEFFSDVLHMAVSANVFLPQPSANGVGLGSADVREGRLPVLWLLHGATDDHTTWQRQTSIERYVINRGLAVVMPSAHLSSYSTMEHGGDFYRYVSEELVEVMGNFFPLSRQREDNFIAGNSMGGYGALKIGINAPERYGVIGCFSGAANTGRPRENTSGLFDSESWNLRNYLVYGGKDYSKTYEDTFYMAEKNKGQPVLPKIFHSCGKDDFALTAARGTRDFFMGMEGNPYRYVYKEHEGDHSWAYWDQYIGEFLDFCMEGD